MNLWHLIITIVAVGMIANFVLVVVVLFVVLEAFGVIDVLKGVHVGDHGKGSR